MHRKMVIVIMMMTVVENEQFDLQLQRDLTQSRESGVMERSSE